MKNTKKNRGFSLVELIVVVAIMAVLVGVLAPSLLRYVEKTRLQKDNSAIAEVAEAMKIAVSGDESLAAKAAETAGITVTFTNAADTAQSINFSAATSPVTNDSTGGAMLTELKATIGSVTTTSATYNKFANAVTINIKTDTNGVLQVTVTNVITVPNATTADSTQPKF